MGDVVSSVMPCDVVSVLPLTRPRPGKCLTVDATPAAASPWMVAATPTETVAGSFPNPRE